MKPWRRGVSFLGYFGVVLLVLVGTVWAYSRGGNDFFVFYEAWRLVLSGKGELIYRVSPDRFLYSPGFAWFLAPLGYFPRSIALGFWCLGKAFSVGFLIKKLSKNIPYRLASLGVILLARPFLIDFEYGQVNLLILTVCVWALLGHFEIKSSPVLDALQWGLMTSVAVGKLYPLPVLLIPWVVTSGVASKKLLIERTAIIVAVLANLFVPMVNLGWNGGLLLLLNWREALFARGLPLESHNQSFAALLHHYLSGNPTAVLAEGGRALFFGGAWLTDQQIVLISFAWTFGVMGIALGWLFAGPRGSIIEWMSILIGLLIVPSHLIWKPYFVMSIPLGICLMHRAMKSRFYLGLSVALFFGINLTGFDFVGHHWAAYFESASILLLMHLTLVIAVAYRPLRFVKY